jgi:hypothetical protein
MMTSNNSDDENREMYEEVQSEEQFIRDMIIENDKVHIVTAPSVHCGSLAFSALIEYQWYPPADPALNDQFELHTRTWGNVVFTVISFPRERKADAQTVAVHLGMTLTNGVPTIVSNDPHDPILGQWETNIIRGRRFPGGVLPNGDDNRRMFSLVSRETIKTTLTPQQVLRRETQLIDKFCEGVMLRPRDVGHFIFGTGDFADENYVQYFLNMSFDELMRIHGNRPLA